MTPQTTGWNELHLAEDPAVELLQSLGYTYVPPEDLEFERATYTEPILTGRLALALSRLNPWLSGPNLTNAVMAVTQVPAASFAEANQKLYTSLTYGIALEQDLGDGRKSHTVRFLDFDNPDRNEWIVTRQYRVLGSKKHVIPDVVAFVNGLPLAVIECKSPTIGDAWKAEAVKQLHRYQEAGTRWKDQGAPKLFEAAQILVGTPLYVVLDLFSRYVVAWMVATRESAGRAQRLIQAACRKQAIEPGQLTLHQDRGAPRTAKTFSQLLVDLDILASYSRPPTADDNPYSESQFKTVRTRTWGPTLVKKCVKWRLHPLKSPCRLSPTGGLFEAIAAGLSSRRKWIVTVRILLPDPSIFAMNDKLYSILLSRLSGCLDGLGLPIMSATCTRSTCRLHGPCSITSRGYVLISLCHFNPPLRG